MNSDARYVFDTNVIVSALLFNVSAPGRAFTRALNLGTIRVSQSLIEESNDVLGRDKFDRYVTREHREIFLEALIGESELVEVTESIRVCRDPTDDRILELAVSGDASIIISGDNDLLVLNPFRGIRVVTPAGLLELLDESSPDSKT